MCTGSEKAARWQVGRTDHIYEDKDDGEVWAHEGRLAAAPPALEGTCCAVASFSSAFHCISQEDVLSRHMPQGALRRNLLSLV